MINEALKKDKLLACLSMVCSAYNVRFSADAAMAGLPLTEGKLTPSLMKRAGEQVGIDAKLEQVSFSVLPAIELPAILILQDNDALVLLKTTESGDFEVLRTEDPNEPTLITQQDLSAIYGGYVVLTRPEVRLEERSEGFSDIEKPSWFWEVLKSNRKIYLHVIIAAFLTNVFVLVAPLFIMNVYDRVVPNQAMMTLWVLAIGALIFFVFDLIARMLRHYLIDMAGRNSDKEMSAKLF